MKTYKKRKKCAICDSKKLTKIVEFGSVPLAGDFPSEIDEMFKIRKQYSTINGKNTYDLNLNFCSNCGLVQTDSVIDPDTLFKDYRYISSVGLQGHFNDVAKIMDDKYGLEGKKVLEIGCNDGVLLEPMKNLGAKCLGIDPAENIVKLAKNKGLDVITGYFDYKKAKSLKFKNKFDIIVSNNTFAHIIDIRSVLKGIEYSLKNGGHFIFEVHYLKSLIEDTQWDNIYHEHIYYYSLTALDYFAKEFGLRIVDFDEIPIHSGSIRVTMQKHSIYKKFTIPVVDKVNNQIKKEKELGLFDVNYFKDFSKKMTKQIDNFNNLLHSIDGDVIGYGASGRANMFCNIVKLTSDDMSYIIDESPERYGRYIANTDIPIYPKSKLDDVDKDTYILILAWNYQDMIIEKLKNIGFSNFLVAFPEPKIIK
jgi:2-polyprenyl-3-methyl-5-hydroxy-6-metoxy-1,4-benzoquinol methylase